MASSAKQARMDLIRMLNLLPYFSRHSGRTVFEAAADFGVSYKQLQEDLLRLQCCGSGLYPDELITLATTRTSVSVKDPQGLDKVVRLTSNEAVALLLILESLEGIDGLIDPTVVQSTVDKLRTLTRQPERAIQSLQDTDDDAVSPEYAELLDVVTDAFTRRMKVSFTYYNRNTDESTQRLADPLQLFTHDGIGYLRCYDNTVKGVRIFRLDGISDATVTDTPSRLPRSDYEKDTSQPFDFSSASETAHLALAPSARWLADESPMDITGELPDGWAAAELPLVSPDWLIRFCLAYGGKVVVTKPEDVSAEIFARAQSALSRYET